MKKPGAKIWVVVKPDAYMHNPLSATPTHRVAIRDDKELQSFEKVLIERNSKAFGETAYGEYFWKRDKKMPEISLEKFLREYDAPAQQRLAGFE